ncbi:hypothetical protein [Coralliovum pocilloporae]|uniref:hypothetical protein n=1 Tax=Coralliovum pocilloporae TaxID=3066369 RepID=UPI003307A557
MTRVSTDWQGNDLFSLDHADECFRNALRRVATYLNSGANRLCSLDWLKQNDDCLARIFEQNGLDDQLIDYFVSNRPEGIRGAARPPDDVRAEHEFYGRFQFQKRRKPDRMHVTFTSTEAFREWGLQRLHPPATDIKALVDLFDEDPVKAFSQAYTNYLVKNYWHNTVHSLLQKINELNFHEFGGDARYDSDFAADNIANILLLRAYGCVINCRGRISLANSDICRRVFALNRCNRVFAERAIRRNEDQDPLAKFQERSWRFRRQVANALSAELLCRGAAVSDIAVYLTGGIAKRKDNRGGYYHTGSVVIRLNQIYINTGIPPYLEDSSDLERPQKRLATIRKNQHMRVADILSHTATRYASILSNDSGAREYAEQSLSMLETKLKFW